jgi:hypothetical protein
VTAVTVLNPGFPKEHALSTHDEINTAGQLAKLRCDVRDIQADVTDLKTEVRAVDRRLDRRLDGLRDRIDEKILSVDAKVYALHRELTAGIDSVRDALQSAKIRALTAMAVLLTGAMIFMMAHGFGWL